MVKVTDYFEETDKEEIIRGASPQPVNYPKPVRRYKLIYEIYNQSIEELYFFILGMLRDNVGFEKIHKITDTFAAAENSAFGGISMQRLSIQQDKVGQFLATIGKMVKELFQLVRELRIIEERLDLYVATYKKKELAAEISLKGYWIDMVEQGGKGVVPSSVYGMARELGFATLPDLFFSAPPIKAEEVETYVKDLEVNRKVKEVLMRKLRTFITWKEKTYVEMNNRFNFTVKYLRQHYDIVKLYMNWIKPYLRAIKKLSMDEQKLASPDMVSAFEGAMVEIEILGEKKIKDHYHFCMLASFLYRARPSMSYTQEGYQRGPLMVGRTTMTLRGYIWTKHDIQKFIEFKEKEDMELLGSYDASLKEAIENLGDDLKRYLQSAGEKFDIEKKKEEKASAIGGTVFEPFISVFKGAAQLFGAFGGPYSKGDQETGTCPYCKASVKIKDRYCDSCGFMLQKPTSLMLYKWEKEKKSGKKMVDASLWLTYKAFKSAHGMISW